MAKKKSMDIAARNAAIHDIKEALKEEHKVFLLFRRELNPIMNELVEYYSANHKKK